MTDWPIQFEHPIWLLGLLIAIPVIGLGLRSLSGLGPWRQRAAILLRVLVLGLLVVLLAGPMHARRLKDLAVIAVVDRSQSVPASLQQRALGYLNAAVKDKPKADRFGVIYTGETAFIQSLPNIGAIPLAGQPPLSGDRTDLEAGVRMAMAVLPSDAARRIVLISDGNENTGDLRGAAAIAQANGVPIDVLSLHYDHAREVIFERLIVPQNTRTGQTISARCVLRSTAPVRGRLVLEDNGVAIDLDPTSPDMGMPVELTAGLNVVTVLLPVSTGGIHRFAAFFTPNDARSDTISGNNAGVGATFVLGRGKVMVVNGDGRSAGEIRRVLKEARLDVEYRPAYQFPTELMDLLGYDSILLVNVPNSAFALAQQEMMVRYVHDMGGGLVMVGGPEGFGAGGWIGSPVEEALPVVLDPPQRQQMPKGALVLIMHSVEMPEGNFWGEQVAIAAVRALSRLDLVGVLDYDWQQGVAWVYPLSPVGDKDRVIAAIRRMQMGDMPSFKDAMEAAFEALKKCDAGQRHMIIISDGDPAPPTAEFLATLKAAKISVSGVAVFPHSPADVQSLHRVAQATGGRFYNVTDPTQLPQIFVKETQVVRRPLIWEKTFRPRVTDPLHELAKGLEAAPPALNGYVLTAEKKELVENILMSPENDPVLAARQYGLGRTVAFTSDATSRWAGPWLTWPCFSQFWEQIVRWSMRSGESPNVQVTTDLEGPRATVQVEATSEDAGFSNFLDIRGVAIDPALKTIPLKLEQVGPGRYQATFPVGKPGSYVVNLKYTDGPKTGIVQGALVVPFAPEFRDLKDNPALLAEAARISGGRLLCGEPKRDALFDRASLTFPRERTPLGKELGILWLAIFLLDVAVRRVAPDFAGIRRKMVDLVARFRRSGERPAAVEALRRRSQEVREKIRKASDPELAGRRYEAPATSRTEQPAAVPRPEASKAETRETKAEKTDTPAAAPPSYIDRLRQAKQKARETMEDEKKEGEK